jgi:uncharacterized membrane protein
MADYREIIGTYKEVPGGIIEAYHAVQNEYSYIPKIAWIGLRWGLSWKYVPLGWTGIFSGLLSPAQLVLSLGVHFLSMLQSQLGVIISSQHSGYFSYLF